MSTFVLVHGAGHGAWCWERTERDLAARGHSSVAVDLPLTSLEEVAAVVCDCLDALEEPAILVGHS
jgi:pimeloyl-ACP methyl ester carboxylesterase